MSREPAFEVGQRVVVTTRDHPRHGAAGSVVEYSTFSHPLFDYYSYVVAFDGPGDRAIVTGDHLRLAD